MSYVYRENVAVKKGADCKIGRIYKREFLFIYFSSFFTSRRLSFTTIISFIIKFIQKKKNKWT